MESRRVAGSRLRARAPPCAALAAQTAALPAYRPREESSPDAARRVPPEFRVRQRPTDRDRRLRWWRSFLSRSQDLPGWVRPAQSLRSIRHYDAAVPAAALARQML